MKETNLKAIKDTASGFLYMDIIPTKYSPIVVMHPIFENGIQYSGKTKEMVDITASEENLDMIRSKKQ
jgi:hypothetical protein